jgi:hypothetical protein
VAAITRRLIGRWRQDVTAIDHTHLPFGPAVYAIKNLVTGECYVGACSELRTRCVGHATKLATGFHHSKTLQASYDKHGPESFEFVVLQRTSLDKLNALELRWYEALRPSLCMRPPVGRPRQGTAMKRMREMRRRKAARERRERQMLTERDLAFTAAK